MVDLTPRNIAVIELITSEQRFLHDMKNILKVIYPSLEQTAVFSPLIVYKTFSLTY
jgi:hypothetical protein